MDNKCPKCGEKLKFLYLKQDCPNCGCDLVYYDMENRLEKDAQTAEKEFALLQQKLGKVIGFFKKFGLFKNK